jgi:tetratricopeptide (TPR) repeat protein
MSLTLLSGCQPLDAFARRIAVAEHLGQAARFREEGRVREALAAVDSALRIVPDDPMAHEVAARYSILIGSRDRIRRHLQRIPDDALSPEEADSFASILLLRDLHADALSLYERAITAHPGNWELENGLAYTLAQGGGDLDRALRLGTDSLRHFDSALAQPLSTSPLRWLSWWLKREAIRATVEDTVGWTYYRKGNYNQALLYLNRAAQRSPNQHEIRFHRAVVLIQLDRTLQATEEVRAILRLRPQHRGARLLLHRLTGENYVPQPKTWSDFWRQFAP